MTPPPVIPAQTAVPVIPSSSVIPVIPSPAASTAAPAAPSVPDKLDCPQGHPVALLQLSDSDNDSSLAASASSASSLSVQQAVQPVAGRLSQSAAERPVDYRLNFY